MNPQDRPACDGDAVTATGVCFRNEANRTSPKPADTKIVAKTFPGFPGTPRAASPSS
jgi:hypothetical protein